MLMNLVLLLQTDMRKPLARDVNRESINNDGEHNLVRPEDL